MKQMVYTSEQKKEILFNGNYKGHDFYIVSYGTHPCAYVEVSHKVKYQELEDEIECHGGLTYDGYLSHLLGITGKYFIGWDYAHWDDYTSFRCLYELEDTKKWTTEEIYEEVKSVIEQLNNLERTK